MNQQDRWHQLIAIYHASDQTSDHTGGMSDEEFAELELALKEFPEAR